MRLLSGKETEIVSGGDCTLWTVTQGTNVLAQYVECDSSTGGIVHAPSTFFGGLQAYQAANQGAGGEYIGGDAAIEAILDGGDSQVFETIKDGLDDPNVIEGIFDNFEALSEEAQDAIKFGIDALEAQAAKLGAIALEMGQDVKAAALFDFASKAGMIGDLLDAPGALGPFLADPANQEAAAEAFAFIASVGVGLVAGSAFASGPIGWAVGAISAAVVQEYGDDFYILAQNTTNYVNNVVSDFVQIYSALHLGDIDPAFDEVIVNEDGTTNIGYFSSLFGITNNGGHLFGP